MIPPAVSSHTYSVPISVFLMDIMVTDADASKSEVLWNGTSWMVRLLDGRRAAVSVVYVTRDQLHLQKKKKNKTVAMQR